MTAPVRTQDYVKWGIADVWYAPADTAEPISTTTLGEPAAPWVGIGYTAEGFSLNFEKETEEARVEEELNAIGEDVTSLSIMLSLAFAEDTIENRVLAYGVGSTTTTAAAAGQIGKKKLTFSTELASVALILMADNGFGFRDRIYIPRVVSTGSVETAYRRTPGEKRLLPTTFKATCELTDISIIQQTAAASA